MKCPHCNATGSVLETRGARRRRTCPNGHRWSTIELPIESLNFSARLRAARTILREKGYLQ